MWLICRPPIVLTFCAHKKYIHVLLVALLLGPLHDLALLHGGRKSRHHDGGSIQSHGGRCKWHAHVNSGVMRRHGSLSTLFDAH
jgi:hypothetical protein